ncbi:molybdenum cofactor guanylyltransferase [Paenibacillus doosanensis]|uniref:Probable molybdenum cofactor guanylyltransferase n=1 Tax=Paenibacillus konkukensis TaxID=2020716 RepID=A0ABY4RMB0_9BACL|nr:MULTISPECIES: molybdenum cofactor guanylyltransferase [Paenibacillus]MCS7461782.1 molybdenum cofactor guanylyltransferase [Paenibacillus doosanensis]UQZ83622.1 putative molybdenum cofactor guanylyltransferase [Paenibacillus konkukensis]
MTTGIYEGLTGVLLAGGRNRRMGGKMKALLPLNGQLFVERQLAELGALCSEILIVANEPAQLEPLLPGYGPPTRIIPDLHPGCGPLAGLQAAMAQASGKLLWVVACDMPYVSAAAAGAMAELLADGAEAADAIVPQLAGKLQPLHALYRARCRFVVDALLAERQYKVMELLSRISCKTADEHFFAARGIAADFAVNVNEPADYEKLIP